MSRYIALLRGVNVGGKALVKMADLKQALTDAGFENVSTYIQSGNVIFDSAESDKKKLGQQVRQTISKAFKIDTSVAIFSASEWQKLIAAAPKWWGHTEGWKHNLLILTDDTTAKGLVKAIGTLKPEIEAIQAGKGAVYQSMSFDQFGKTVTGKLASHPLYKSITIRNYNTSTKLVALLDD